MKTAMLGDKLVLNHQISNVSEVATEISSFDNCIYEVIRVVNSVPLFVEDHFFRLNNSKISLDFICNYSLHQMKSDLIMLISTTNIENGNIRLDIRWINQNCNILVYQITHAYPSNRLYETGIKMKSFCVERPKPNIKQESVNANIRKHIKSLISQDIYEVLLLNHLNYVTEGSKSNVLFIHEETIFSPPVKDILEGITRKKVIYLAEKLGYKVKNKRVSYDTISNYDACFITGTSPKILPVYQIDDFFFNPKHHIISALSMAYEKEIDAYCNI